MIMKKFFKILIIIVIFALLVVDFYGLWKYKLSGTTYELASSDDVGPDDVADGDDGDSEDSQDNTNYTELTSASMKNGEKLFIKNIEQLEDKKYEIKGLLYKPYEVSKDDYNALRNGKAVNILGAEYKKDKIQSNNLILKSSDDNAKDYYVKYDTTSKKYVLKDSKTDYEIYTKTEKYVKISVDKGTDFNTEKNGKTEKSKIENVVEKHKNTEEHEEKDEKVSLCTLTFDKKGNCTKIVETVR